jgi:hypothetical protein
LLETPAHKPHVSNRPSSGEYLASQTSLANAWLAVEQYEAPTSLCNLPEDRQDVVELGFASDQWPIAAARSDHGASMIARCAIGNRRH